MALIAIASAGTASAAAISFPAGGTYASPLVTPEATFANTSCGSIFVGAGGMCFLSPTAFSCEGDGTIAFTDPVQNLLVTTAFFDAGQRQSRLHSA